MPVPLWRIGCSASSLLCPVGAGRGALVSAAESSGQPQRSHRRRFLIRRGLPPAVPRPESRLALRGIPAAFERVLFHLVQQCARHVGHLDIVSELADGQVGEQRPGCPAEAAPGQAACTSSPGSTRNASEALPLPPRDFAGVDAPALRSPEEPATSTWCGMTCGTPGSPGWLMPVSRCTSYGRSPGTAR